MNEQIKQRIVQLNNGEVPNGYEKTEFGIFPKDWVLKTIGEVSLVRGSYGLNAPACVYEEGLPKYLRITDIDENGNYINNDAYVNHKESKNYILHENDIVFARTGASVGKNYLYSSKDGELSYAGFLIKFSIDETKCVPYMVKANCRGTRYDKWVQIMSTRSGQPGINAEEYADFCLIVPNSIEEQSKIAEILMKWDEAIELQEQYIQTLLSMKITYVDKFFCAPGEEKTKFDLLYKTAGEGGTPDTKKQAYYDSEDVPFVKIEHLAEKYITKIDSYISNLGLQKSGAWLVPENCLIFSNGATIGEASINKIPVATKQGILGIVPSNVIDVEYFYYLVKSKYFLSKVKKITTKGTMCTAYLKDINNLNLFIHGKEEQIKIAKILSLIDCLIEDEKKKVDVLKKQRKVLQQYLLNGIVRVK